MTYNLSLPFDDLYAWENFIKLLVKQRSGQTLVFYGFGRRLGFRRLTEGKVAILSQSLTEPETVETTKQRCFEKVFMKEILKDTNKHLHIYERSATKNPDWAKQIYLCVDPDCRHYCQAQFILGKRARCHKCQEPFVIEREKITKFAVTGLCCSKSKKAQAFKKAQEILVEVMPPVEEPLLEIEHEVFPELGFLKHEDEERIEK